MTSAGVKAEKTSRCAVQRDVFLQGIFLGHFDDKLAAK